MTAVDELEAVLLSLRGIWDEEAVDELDHALQAGYLARADHADDELILACEPASQPTRSPNRGVSH